MTDNTITAKRSGEFRLHPLGFYYLLDKIAGVATRRIHIWLSPDITHPENDRHQHSFDIRSQILAGRLRSDLFLFHETPSGLEREFVVHYQEGRSELVPTGREGELACFCSFESVAGTRYFLKAGTIHRATAIQTPCVTILHTEDREIDILSYGRNMNELPFSRRRVNEEEADAIATVLRSIPNLISR